MKARFAWLLGVVALAVVLFGCAPGGGGGAAAGGDGGGETGTAENPVTITMWYALGGGEEEYLKQQARAFSEQNPNINVKLLNVPFEELQRKYIQATPSGKGPDVLYGVNDWLGTLQEGGFIADLTGKYDTGRYLDSTVQAATYKDKVYAVPEAYEIVTQYYHPDLLKQPPQNIRELGQAAQSLPKGKTALAFDITNFYFSAPFLYAVGGRLFDDRGNFVLTEQKATEWLETMQRIQKAANMPEEVTGPAAVALFNEKNSASYYSGPWDVDTFKQANTKFELAKLPEVDGNTPQPFLGTKMMYVSSRTNKMDAALEWATFYSGKESEVDWVADVNPAHLPAVKAAYDDPALADNEITQAFRKQAETSVPLPGYPAMGQVWTPGQEALSAVLNGGAEPAKAARDMVNEIKSKVEEEEG
jgi:arabinogalactan oligomer/maltooligosaccharide transport system substrate-binding protein